MEATLRTAAEKVTGQPAEKLDFTEVRAVEGLREATVKLGDKELRVAVANGLSNARIILDKVAAGQRAISSYRNYGLPGRLLRRRRPALSAAQC